MRGKVGAPKNLRIVLWSLAIGLILLVILLFLIPALLGSGSIQTANPGAQETGKSIYATSTVMQRVIGAIEAAWTQTAQVTPEPDQ